MIKTLQMAVTRTDFINEARNYINIKFGHQGRNKMTGLDCGGLILVVARKLGLTELEELGYALYPTNGRFEELLHAHANFLGWESPFPHNFNGSELLPGDLLSFDYGEGTSHIALASKWDGRHYRVLDATPRFGVAEHPLRSPFTGKGTVLKGWGIRGIGAR